MLRKGLFVIVTMGVMLSSCKEKEQTVSPAEGVKEMEIKITSAAFEDGGFIPAKHSLRGGNMSPPLQWQGVPPAAKSVALIMDDPDAPSGTWVHWVLFNLLPSAGKLPEALVKDETLADGTRQGINDFGKTGYDGPSPPWGTHRYVFTIYALDKIIDIVAVANKAELLKAMEGHILAKGQLTGKYKK